MFVRSIVRPACRLIAVCCLASGPLRSQNGPPASSAESAYPQPGDRIVVQIFGEEHVTDTITITPRGLVVLPKLGPIDVSSFTVGTISDTLRARYGRYLKSPTVDVLFLRRVAVNGEVKKPDVYYLDLSATLRDAIARAGGVADNGNARKVSIVRGSQTINVPDWDRASAANTDLRSGDLVLVGRRSWWSQNILSAMTASAAVISLVISLSR